MANVAISGDTSGAVTLTVPATAGTQTVTFPAATGTAMVSGNMPAFSATLSAFTTISNSTWTKIACNTEQFDTASAYDNATNYRFTPLVAGYYQISGIAGYDAGVAQGTAMQVAIYKNGTLYRSINYNNSNLIAPNVGISFLIYFNGSTDYVELYGFTTGGTTVGFSTASSFSGAMVRAA
jgi:hypothetical protein